jgi:hypothetical protein
MKQLKIKNILNYKIFLKNKGIINIYTGKESSKKILKIHLFSNDYNSHILWRLESKKRVNTTTQEYIKKKL